ncbi:MAG TPA: hypothetical protein VI895_01705 [Bdellovibrionota bacterium]|nr:hypothetical protein [Bdellovibrionota bacterium]
MRSENLIERQLKTLPARVWASLLGIAILISYSAHFSLIDKKPIDSNARSIVRAELAKAANAGIDTPGVNSLASLRFQSETADPSLNAAYNVDPHVRSILQLILHPRETLATSRK